MVKLVLIDLSGTLYTENQVLPGCDDALHRLLETNLQVKYLTNHTKESRRQLHKRLTLLGFNTNKEDIYSSLFIAREIMVSRGWRPYLMLSKEAMEDFDGVGCKKNEKPDAVLIGLAPTEFRYERLNEAFRHITQGASLVVLNSNKYSYRNNVRVLGPGCFIKGLEYSADCTAEVIGKPTEAFYKAALEGESAKEAIMIGDDVIDDIQGAMKAGIKGYLIKTGHYQEDDEFHISPGPTAIFDTFVEAVDDILGQIGARRTSDASALPVSTKSSKLKVKASKSKDLLSKKDKPGRERSASVPNEKITGATSKRRKSSEERKVEDASKSKIKFDSTAVSRKSESKALTKSTKGDVVTLKASASSLASKKSNLKATSKYDTDDEEEVASRYPQKSSKRSSKDDRSRKRRDASPSKGTLASRSTRKGDSSSEDEDERLTRKSGRSARRDPSTKSSKISTRSSITTLEKISR